MWIGSLFRYRGYDFLAGLFLGCFGMGDCLLLVRFLGVYFGGSWPLRFDGGWYNILFGCRWFGVRVCCGFGLRGFGVGCAVVICCFGDLCGGWYVLRACGGCWLTYVKMWF